MDGSLQGCTMGLGVGTHKKVVWGATCFDHRGRPHVILAEFLIGQDVVFDGNVFVLNESVVERRLHGRHAEHRVASFFNWALENKI